MSRREKIRQFTRIVVLLVIAAALLSLVLFVQMHYEVTEVHVTGNSHYTEEEILSFVMPKGYEKNSLYLRLRYGNRPIRGIPFIERIDVSVEGPHEVTIEVYEKAIAGYVSYLDRFMYFDKDGIIVESSLKEEDGIPNVAGLRFSQCVLNEPLPVADPKVFEQILAITQLLTKYEISTDCIYFGNSGTITLYFGEARVALGTMDNIDEKMIKLKAIVPELSGLKGVLHMETYTEDTNETYVTFEKE